MLEALLEELIEAAPMSRWARMKAMRGPSFMRKKFSTQAQLKQRAKFAKVPTTPSSSGASSSSAQAAVAGVSKTEAIATPTMTDPVEDTKASVRSRLATLGKVLVKKR